MAKATTQPVPKVHGGVPSGHKVPLGAYIQQLNTPGMNPSEMLGSALLIQSGKAGHGGNK